MAPLHEGAKVYVDRVNAGVPVWELTLEEARAGTDAETPDVFGPADDVAAVEERTIEGPRGPVRLRVYRPDAAAVLPTLVYFHGGGWVVGSLDSHDPVCRAIAARTPSLVVSVDYRLAPEHPFPAGLDDAWAATRWAAGHAAELGGDPGRLGVSGDSAGGNLAAVVALRARDAGLPVALQVLVYPVIDHDLDSPGYRDHGAGLNLTRAKMEWYWARYLNGERGDHPEASPSRAPDLGGVAPALIQTAEYDPLAWEGEKYARLLQEAGVPVTLSRYEGQIHGFVRLPALCGQASWDALAEIAAALRTVRAPASVNR